MQLNRDTKDKATAIVFALETARRYYLKRADETRAKGMGMVAIDYEQRADEAERIADEILQDISE